MTRRTFWATLLLVPVMLAAPAAEGAAAAGKVHRLGVLALAPPAFAAPYIEACRQELRALGYVEGQNLAVDFRFVAGRFELLPSLAAEIVSLQPDVIIAVGDRAVQAIKEATSTIPLVMVSAGDPVRSGFVASLARPGGNVTGLSSLLPELNAKELSILKEAVPKVSRVAVLWNPRSHGGVLGFKEMQAAAPSLHVSLQSLEVRTPDEMEPAFAAMAREQAGALIVLTDPLTFGNRNRLLELAARGRIPSMFEVREFVDAGGLMSYGPSLITMIRRSAVYIDKILKGAKPADLPVEQPTRFELVINLKTAKALGLTIPPSILIRADQVIQ